MMLTLLLYSYCIGVFSSRKIMARCQTDAAFRVIVGNDIPDFRTNCFAHRERFDQRLSENASSGHECVVRRGAAFVCPVGLVEGGSIGVGWFEVQSQCIASQGDESFCSNCGPVKSRHFNQSLLDGANRELSEKDRMTQEEERLQKEIAELLEQAQQVDAAEDEQHGKDRSGEEIPEELVRRQSRLKKIQEAKAALEEQAREKARAHKEKLEAEGKTPRKDPEDAVPKGTDQRNFTDPESKIMKTSNKGFDRHGRIKRIAGTASLLRQNKEFPWLTSRSHRCGNAQAVGNENQIIVAAAVTNQANDLQQVSAMLEQTQANLKAAGVKDKPKEFLADAGYFSEENVKTIEAAQMNPFIATQRLKHHEEIPAAPQGRMPKDLSAKQKMARKNRTKKGRETYSKRKWMIEPQ